MPAPLGPRLRRTLSAPGPWLVALGFFLYSGQWLAVVGFLPTVYQQAGYIGGWVAVLTALAAAVNIIGNVMAGRLLAKGVGPGRLMSIAYGVMGMGAVLAFAGDVPPMVAYLAVLLFSGRGRPDSRHPVWRVGAPRARRRHRFHHGGLDAAALGAGPVHWPARGGLAGFGRWAIGIGRGLRPGLVRCWGCGWRLGCRGLGLGSRSSWQFAPKWLF